MRAPLLLLAVLLLAGCAGEEPAPEAGTTTATTVASTPPAGAPTTTTPPAAPPAGGPREPVPVSIRGLAFEPANLLVDVGDRVVWTNAEEIVQHTVTADDGSFDSSTLRPGDAFERAFDAAGRFEYECSFHPSMRGTVLVEERV